MNLYYFSNTNKIMYRRKDIDLPLSSIHFPIF